MTKTYYFFRLRPVFSCCLMFFIFYYVAPAQNHLISGQITDGQEPISGASIIIKHTIKGTVSDFDGHYELDAQAIDTLQISYLGYKTQELVVGNQRTIDVVLQEDATALGEVVINAGYYTVKERERTGSIAKVDAQVIENQPVNNALEALQGQVAGLDITQTTGLAGGGYTVRIRGQNSMAAGNEPLYVVDGVPYDAETMGYMGLSGTIIPNGNISPLNMLNPSIIESVEILKDADATAIYGSRASNGVVLITTKKGKAGKTKITIEANSGQTFVTRKMDLMNTEQYLEMRREAFANDGITDYPVSAYDVNGTWDENRNTNWQELFLGNTAMMHQVRGTVSGGNKHNRFLLGGTAQKEETILKGDFNYQRITSFINFSHQSPNDKFKAQFTSNYALENNKLPATDLARSARFLSPNAPKLYDEEGNLNWENSTWTNPLASLESKYTNNIKSLIANGVISYMLADGLEIKTNLGYTMSNLKEIKTSPHIMYNPAFGLTSAISNSQTNHSNRSSWIFEPQLDYTTKLGNGILQATLGTTFQERTGEQYVVLASGFSSNNLITNLSAANQIFVLNETNTQYRYHAVYGRMNYIYNDKYIINLTGRRDGSSRFGVKNRYANFGAVGAAWLFSRESFIQEGLPMLSYGKLRGSYGTTGNDQIGDYQYLNTYQVSNYDYNGSAGLQPSRLWNPYFAWEKNRKMEIAMELGFLNDQLSVSTGFFHNRSDNQLVGVPLPGTTGFTSIRSNLDAVVINKGWEFDVNVKLFQKKQFRLSTGLNLTLPKNKLKEFEGLENSTYANQYVIGQPISILKLYKFKGVDPETGLFTFEDYNGDGTISAPEDRQHIENLAPTLYGGLSSNISYKNWDFNFLVQFTKQKAPNYFYGSPPVGTMFNQPTEVLDRWQQPGDEASFQRYTAGMDAEAAIAYTNYTMSNAAVTDASFIRLKNIALSYSLPKEWVQHTNLKVYLQAQNLLTITDFKGGDPEQRSGFSPPLKRINIGTILSF